MKIKTRDRDDIAILDISGEITIGQGDVQLRKEINELVNNKEIVNIILNLSKVSFIDSSGIGEIVRSYTTVQKHGGKLKLMGLESKVRDLLTITQLITVFECFEGEEEAVASYK
ncbi:STAS domain-containing protein [bacterium]|nr:STAS domain-containing protein [candidate division CSSED10-310 bacterium]